MGPGSACRPFISKGNHVSGCLADDGHREGDPQGIESPRQQGGSAMKQGLMIVTLVCMPQIVAAQELRIDPQIVRSCFATTEIGAMYPPCLGQASGQCQTQPGGSTTIGITDCILAETREWDAILNAQYQATQAHAAEMDAAVPSSMMDRSDALRDAQRAWIAFRMPIAGRAMRCGRTARSGPSSGRIAG